MDDYNSDLDADNTLVARIGHAITQDDDDQSDRLVQTYEEASPAEKAAIDACFICLCGWSLDTLIHHPERVY